METLNYVKMNVIKEHSGGISSLLNGMNNYKVLNNSLSTIFTVVCLQCLTVHAFSINHSYLIRSCNKPTNDNDNSNYSRRFVLLRSLLPQNFVTWQKTRS